MLKVKNKLIYCVLCLLMSFGLVMFGLGVSEDVYASTNCDTGHTYQNGFCTVCDAYESARLTVDKYDINGDGEKDEVFEISNGGQLYWFAWYVNGEGELENPHDDANAVLLKDIVVNEGDLSGYDGESSNEWREWTPINYYGSYSLLYFGTFDGQNHSISGLYLNDNTRDDIGLILDNAGTIRNVGIVNSYFSGNTNIGAITSSNNGVIQNCYNTGTISGTGFMGGIAADNLEYVEPDATIIENCYNAGKIIVRDDPDDGYEASMIGGISGFNLQSAHIENCYNTGDIEYQGESSDVCGIIGMADNAEKIVNCYYLEGTATNGGIDENYENIESIVSKSQTDFDNGAVCDLVQYHIGGSATCSEKADCMVCGEQDYSELAAHVGGEATCSQKAVCSVCDEEYGDYAAHTGGEATCYSYAKCTVCGADYGDLESHTEGTQWTKNDTHHWTCCVNGIDGGSCEEIFNYAEHTYGDWVVTKEATEDEEGLKAKVCVCGKEVTEVIPKVEPEGMSGGTIALIATGSTVTLGGIIAAIVIFYLKKKKNS